jgi:RNA methyltransferase, TrmH family
VSEFKKGRCRILASEPPGNTSRPIRDITRLPSRAVIALGNESRGLSDTTLKEAHLRFHIPVSRQIDSLNVAASAAIAAFYFSTLPRDGEGDR